MANPQPDIFVKLSKEWLAGKCRHRFSGQQNQFLEAVILLTWGNIPPRKLTRYSGKDIADLTGLTRRQVYKIKCQLINALAIIVTQKGDNKSEMIGINKDFDSYKTSPKKETCHPKRRHLSPKKETLAIPTYSSKKEVYPATKKTTRKIPTDQPAFQLAELLFILISKNFPDFPKKDINKWATHTDRLIRIDKQKPEKIRMIIHWCQKDTFWQKQILSTKNLRDKFDRLSVLTFGKTNGSTQTYFYPVCASCHTQANNIKKGQPCPYCGKDTEHAKNKRS